MKEITFKDFTVSQPPFPEPHETDIFYVELANELFEEAYRHDFAKVMPKDLVKKIALTLTDYMQDIVSDAGIWRSFITANRQLYSYTLPFYSTDDEYIDFELNRQDVRFLVWYVIVMLWEEQRNLYPYDERLLEFSDACFKVLYSKYEESPLPDHYNIAKNLDFKDIEDRDKIMGQWLFLHSYLLTPAYANSLKELASQINPEDPDFNSKLNTRLEESMMNDTTGPLALFTPEWVYLILEGRIPPDHSSNNGEIHKYYKAFTNYTGGKELMFFDSYESLNQFFIKALGWEEGEEHLAQVKGQHDYILMVNKEKGMLMAMNIARCIKFSDNPLYDQEYARKNAFRLLVEPGLCPGDLLRTILKHDWLSDASFPGTNDFETVNKYADFIARCFLQIYYRGD